LVKGEKVSDRPGKVRDQEAPRRSKSVSVTIDMMCDHKRRMWKKKILPFGRQQTIVEWSMSEGMQFSDEESEEENKLIDWLVDWLC